MLPITALRRYVSCWMISSPLILQCTVANIARPNKRDDDLASISAEINSEFPSIDIGGLQATVDSLLNGISSDYPSLSISTLPDYSDYAKSEKPTASVFTGPYVSDIVQSFSQFNKTRISGQTFSFPCEYSITTRYRTLEAYVDDMTAPTLAPPSNVPQGTDTGKFTYLIARLTFVTSTDLSGISIRHRLTNGYLRCTKQNQSRRARRWWDRLSRRYLRCTRQNQSRRARR